MNKLKLIKIALITNYKLMITKIAFAQGGLVPCSGLDCNLCDLLTLFKNIIELVLKIGVALAALFIAWGAFVIMTAGMRGSEKGQMGLAEGKKIITTAITGVVIMLAAWLIIATVLQIVSGSPSYLPWNAIQCTF